MKKMMAVAALSTLVLAGCSTQKFNLNPGADLTSDAALSTSQTFFLSGIGQEKEVDAAEVCDGADKVAQVATKLTFMNGFWGAVSFGIYTPRTVIVHCVG
jgi:hypothetical protein